MVRSTIVLDPTQPGAGNDMLRREMVLAAYGLGGTKFLYFPDAVAQYADIKGYPALYQYLYELKRETAGTVQEYEIEWFSKSLKSMEYWHNKVGAYPGISDAAIAQIDQKSTSEFEAKKKELEAKHPKWSKSFDYDKHISDDNLTDLLTDYVGSRDALLEREKFDELAAKVSRS